MAASQKNTRDALAQSKEESKNAVSEAELDKATVSVEKPSEKAGATQEASRRRKKGAVYTAEEFVANAEVIFQTKPECVQAALREKNITECTKDEAKRALEEFMKKEVQ